MTTIGAAAPRMQAATTAEPRFKVPVPRELSYDEQLNASLVRHGIDRADYDADTEKLRRWAAESDKQRQASGAVVPTFAGVADAASYGRGLVASLGAVMDTANGLRQALGSTETDAQLRKLFGDEWADVRLGRLREGIAVMERGVAGYEREIGEKFSVQGALSRRDEAGNLSLGAFVIEHRAGGAAARVGSDGTAWVAGGDGAFRRAESARSSEPAAPTPERVALLA